MKKISIILLSIGMILLGESSVYALPHLQLYSGTGSWYGEIKGIEDSWITDDPIFDLTVAGFGLPGKPARGPYPAEPSSPLKDIYLLLSVLESELGAGNILLDGANITDFVDTPSLTTPPWTGDNHNPLNKTEVYDYVLFYLGDFLETQSIHAFSPDEQLGDGSFPINANVLGEERLVSVNISGYTLVHFDVFGYINGEFYRAPPSHNALFDPPGSPPVPEPATMTLIMSGIVGLIGHRRRINI